MVRLEVEPGWLGNAASSHATLGDGFATMGGAVADVAGGAAGGAGDPALGHAIGAAGQQFSAGLASLTREMHGLAANLSAAAEAYRVTDESVMPS